MLFRNAHLKRGHRFFGGRALLLAVLLGILVSQPAFAAHSGCRSDPVVILSNGQILDLSADIGTSLWNVTSVTYTLHIPSNVAVLAYVRTPDWLTTQEQFVVVRDSPRRAFMSDTVVQTSDQDVAVTAHLALVSILNLVIAQASADGQQFQDVITNISY